MGAESGERRAVLFEIINISNNKNLNIRK